MIKSTKDETIFIEKIIDKLFSWLKKNVYDNFIEKSEKSATKCGLTLLYFIAAMSLITSIVLVLKYNALSTAYVLISGIVGLLVAIVFQYIAAKTIPALNLLINNTPVKQSSTVILDIFAICVGILGVIALLGGLVISIKISDFEFFVLGFATFIVCEYWLAIALKPETLNIEIVKNISAGEEFIGILTFFAKGSLKLIPLVFCGAMIFTSYQLIAMMFIKYQYIPEINLSAILVTYSLCGALLPLFGYISFIAYYFTIDIARAILSIPEKLDKK